MSLTKEFQYVQKEYTGGYFYLPHILMTINRRWQTYKRLASIVNLLPINGSIQNSRLGSVIDFSIPEKSQPAKPFSKEALQSTLQAIVTEWQVLHLEIDRSWTWQGNFFNYILLIIGSVITLVSAFPNLELLFIIASFILSLTGWAIIEKSIHMMNIGRYFSKELIPRANTLIREMENVEPHFQVANQLKILMWEEFFRGGNIHIAMQGLASTGRFLMATVPGFASAMTFFYLKQTSGTIWSSLEVVLFSIATGMSLLPFTTMIINARYAYSGEQN